MSSLLARVLFFSSFSSFSPFSSRGEPVSMLNWAGRAASNDDETPTGTSQREQQSGYTGTPPRTLIAIPTYNERENIETLLAEILHALPSTDLLIIDDHSPDGTGALVDDLAARDPRIHVMHRAGKLGLGTAYIAGFEYAISQGYEYVFEMDADFSHDPRVLPDLLAAATRGADLVIGSRYIPGGSTPNWPLLRKIISGGGNTFARGLLRIPTHDCTSGFRCYRTSALQTLNLRAIHATGYAFQVELAYNFWKSGFQVREVPITFVDRRVGKSKMSRKIFVEAFLWVLRARLTGDAAVRRAPAAAIQQG